MTLRNCLIVALLFVFQIGKALESQIILIQSEAYLVTLDENYDVVTVLERVPDYFQDLSTHEEILAEQIQQNRSESYGCNDLLLEKNVEDIQILACSSLNAKHAISLIQLDDNRSTYNNTIHRIDPRYRAYDSHLKLAA